MEFPYLASIGVRSLGLAAAAGASMKVGRVKSPAAQHAVWTLVTAGMLAVAAASAVMPAVPVPVPGTGSQAEVAAIAAAAAPIDSLKAARPFTWNAIYFAGLLAFAGRMGYGWLLTRRLVRASRVLNGGLYECGRIAAPVTVGWTRPKILLPPDWCDWAVAVLAGVNRCVFWFHPLAWWLESHLRTLAEMACDDACLGQVPSRECYAQALVEMAGAVSRGPGRAAWGAMAMARSSAVRARVERILDERRPVFPAMTRARWAAMAACAVPLVLMAASVRPARVRAQEAPPRPAPAAQVEPWRYFVQGEVSRPGEYRLLAPTRVLLALVNAGGFREPADKSDIVIVRAAKGGERLHFNYNEVIHHQNPGQNVYLQPGDIVVVR